MGTILIGRKSSPGSLPAEEEVAALTGGMGSESVDCYGEEVLTVVLPVLTGVCEVCGGELAHVFHVAEEPTDIVHISEELNMHVGVVAGYTVSVGRPYRKVGNVRTCADHSYMESNLVPVGRVAKLSHVPGPYVPGVYRCVGGLDERNRPYYAIVFVPLGQYPCDIDSNLLGDIVTWKNIYPHGTVDDWKREKEL